MSPLQKKKRESFRGIMATKAGSLADRNSEWSQMSRCFQEFVDLVTHSVVFSTNTKSLNAFSYVAKPSHYVMLLHNSILRTKQSRKQEVGIRHQVFADMLPPQAWRHKFKRVAKQIYFDSALQTWRLFRLHTCKMCKSMKMCFRSKSKEMKIQVDLILKRKICKEQLKARRSEGCNFTGPTENEFW